LIASYEPGSAYNAKQLSFDVDVELGGVVDQNLLVGGRIRIVQKIVVRENLRRFL
jgi:hypothetical protein